jgi:hypothetical protein
VKESSCTEVGKGVQESSYTSGEGGAGEMKCVMKYQFICGIDLG